MILFYLSFSAINIKMIKSHQNDFFMNIFVMLGCSIFMFSHLFFLCFLAGTISSWVVIFILPINSALNPILYTLTTRPFKETILQVWANYRQKRPLLSGHPPHHPSLTWQEMWPLQENSHGVSPGCPLEAKDTAAKLTPVENPDEGYNDFNASTKQQQQKQHAVLSVCSQNKTVPQTLTHIHTFTQTNDLL